jgi:histidinol phosphatase-like enzyme
MLPKHAVFRSIQQRFGDAAAYVAVGDGTEELDAAANMKWPFVRVCVCLHICVIRRDLFVCNEWCLP